MSKEKTDAFIKEYGELVEKHGIDFAHYPMFVPDGTPGGFRFVLQSTPVSVNKDKEAFIAAE
jgi:hypothetical protein